MAAQNVKVFEVTFNLNGPNRKVIRLQHFDYSSSGAYFLTLCIHNRRNLLGRIVQTSDGASLQGYKNRPDRMIQKWLHELEGKFDNVALDYYVIMPNHVHLIIFLDGKNVANDVPRIMDWFKTMTVNEYIRGVKRGQYVPFSKRLWQRGYFDHVIRNEEDLYRCRKYIAENPEKWLLDELYFQEE